MKNETTTFAIFSTSNKCPGQTSSSSSSSSSFCWKKFDRIILRKSFRIRSIDKVEHFPVYRLVIFQPATLPHFRNMKVSLLVIEWWIIISLISLIFFYIYIKLEDYVTNFVNYISYIENFEILFMWKSNLIYFFSQCIIIFYLQCCYV